MKRVISSIAAVMIIATSVLVGGCSLSPEQVKTISQNAGMFAAVGWIAYDNPEHSVIDSVKSILDVVKIKCAQIEAGDTYIEVVYPELVTIIDKDIKPQDRPLCKAAALTLLNGLDTLFAMHPEWKKDQDVALDVVNAFILGAQNGLSLGEDSHIIKQARRAYSTRAKIYRP